MDISFFLSVILISSVFPIMLYGNVIWNFIKVFFYENFIWKKDSSKKNELEFDENIYDQDIIDTKFKEKYSKSLIKAVYRIVTMFRHMDYALTSKDVADHTDSLMSKTKYISISSNAVYFSTSLWEISANVNKFFYYKSSLSDIKEYVDEIMTYYIWNKLTPYEIVVTTTALSTKYLHKEDTKRFDYLWKILADFTVENQELISFHMAKKHISNLNEKKISIILENIDESFIQNFNNTSHNSNSFFPPVRTYLKYFFHFADEEQKIQMADMIAEKIKSFKWIPSVKKIQASKRLIPAKYLMEAIK